MDVVLLAKSYLVELSCLLFQQTSAVKQAKYILMDWSGGIVIIEHPFSDNK